MLHQWPFSLPQNQHTRKLISAWMTSHKPTNKRPELPTVTLTWHASKYKVRKLQQPRYLSFNPSVLAARAVPLLWGSPRLPGHLVLLSVPLQSPLGRLSLSLFSQPPTFFFHFSFPLCSTDVYPVSLWWKWDFFILFLLSTSLSLARNSGCLTWVRHSSHKSSATHSYRRVQYFHVSE